MHDIASPDFFLHMLCANCSNWLAARSRESTLPVKHVVANVIRQIVTRPVLIEMFTRSLDGCVPLQVALHANLVAPLRARASLDSQWPRPSHVPLPARGSVHRSHPRGEIMATRIDSRCPRWADEFR